MYGSIKFYVKTFCCLVVFYSGALRELCNGSTFCPITSPMGDFIYIVDNPSSVILGVTISGCASQCAFYIALNGGTSPCRCFNYDSNVANCSLYIFDPTTPAFDPNGFITAYQFTDRPVASLAGYYGVASVQIPYEYNDQIYTDCHYNNRPTSSGQCQFGCILPDGRQAYCKQQPVKTVDENVALNKKPLQWPTSVDPRQSNDGNDQKMSCTSAPATNAWWAVDLGQQYLIREVDVYQLNYYAWALNYFSVLLSNVQPTNDQPLSVGTLCAQYNGTYTAKTWATVYCQDAPARYVVVQGSLTSQTFCLTEVAVKVKYNHSYPLVSSKWCSYPYTYRGQLYHSCMQNVASVTTPSYPFVCLVTNYTLATCYSPASYVAQVANKTVKVTGQADRVTLSVSGWIAFFLRKVGVNDGKWNLPWTDYVNGFGFNATYLWLGLERIHQLTTTGNWRLRVEYYYSNSWVSAEYWAFTVGSSNTFYTINFDGYVGDDGNALMVNGPNSYGNINGMSFSTIDSDHDLSTVSCSSLNGGGGWWYKSCAYLKLTDTSPITVITDPSQVVSEAHVMMKAR